MGDYELLCRRIGRDRADRLLSLGYLDPVEEPMPRGISYSTGMVEGDQVVSIFSGAGGCSLGFAQAGLRPVAAADIDGDAATTYTRNLGLDCSVVDLSSEAAVRIIADRAGPKRPFILVGGPPCQGFSTAGPRDGNDPRNRLIYNYLALVERMRPRWFLFENVEGLLTSGGGRDVARLTEELISLGYVVRVQKVNFAGYGLPQTRKRILIIGNRVGLRFALPEAAYSYDSGKAKARNHCRFAPPLLEAISDLPIPTTADASLPYGNVEPTGAYAASLRSNTGVVRHHFATAQQSVAMIAAALRPGQTMKDLPIDLQHASYHRRANRRVSDGTPTEKRGGAPSGYKRLRGDLNSLTITSAASREFIHPTEDRPLTLRECARLQSFPDDYTFAGRPDSIAKQIGNAIPPIAAKELAEAIVSADGRAGGWRADGLAPQLLGFHLTDSIGMSPALSRTSARLSAMLEQPRTGELPFRAYG